MHVLIRREIGELNFPSESMLQFYLHKQITINSWKWWQSPLRTDDPDFYQTENPQSCKHLANA